MPSSRGDRRGLFILENAIDRATDHAMAAINPDSKWTRNLMDTSDSKLNLEINVASPNIWLCVSSSIGILRDVSEISRSVPY
jgi:hypothetical protein